MPASDLCTLLYIIFGQSELLSMILTEAPTTVGSAKHLEMVLPGGTDACFIQEVRALNLPCYKSIRRKDDDSLRYPMVIFRSAWSRIPTSIGERITKGSHGKNANEMEIT